MLQLYYIILNIVVAKLCTLAVKCTPMMPLAVKGYLHATESSQFGKRPRRNLADLIVFQPTATYIPQALCINYVTYLRT